MLVRRAQSINEYAMVIAIITLAAVTMQTHIKRGIQGVIKRTADDLVTGWKLETAPPTPVVLPDGRILESELHPTAKEYKKINGGFVWGERQGNTIYYYHFTSNPDDKTLIGIEDTITHDYTEFGPDGFACGVANKGRDKKGEEISVPYLDLKFIRNEDAKHEVISVTVQKKVDDKEIGTYGKYERVRLSSGAAGEATAQQKGIEELGLYAYTEPAGPLRVTNNPSLHSGLLPKTVTVTEFALSSITIPRTSYHICIRRNFGKAAVKTKIKGNNVYYYLIATDSLIGIEDALTRDLTIFDKDGFVNWVFSETGPYTDTEIKLTYNHDPVEPTKVISVTVERKAGVTYVKVGTYGKYQPVRISQVAATNLSTDPLPEIVARETVSSEKTNVSGGWEATYKLGAETFGSLEKKKTGDGRGTSPLPPKDILPK